MQIKLTLCLMLPILPQQCTNNHIIMSQSSEADDVQPNETINALK